MFRMSSRMGQYYNLMLQAQRQHSTPAVMKHKAAATVQSERYILEQRCSIFRGPHPPMPP